MITAAPTPKLNMGEPVPRLDAQLKVTGAARYPSDVPVDNVAYSVLVTSAIAKGRIEKIDSTSARSVPGVLAVFTYENTEELKLIPYGGAGSGPSSSIQKLGPDILQAGQIVALVVADTLEAAQEGAAKLDIAYFVEAPAATFDSPGTTISDAKSAKPPKNPPRKGDVEAALAIADAVLDENYSTPAQHHNPIELFTTTCHWSNGQLTIYEPSQFVYGIKNSVAKVLGIDADKVRVVSHYVGGAFGSKSQLTPRTALVALAAKKINRPVKLVATRAQGFTIATYRAETRHHIVLGAEKSGKLVAYRHHGLELSSRPDSYCVAGVMDSAHLYAFGTVDTSVNIVHADRNTPGFMRSPPVIPYIYALESAMDEMAIKLGLDPVEFRRINDTTVDPITGKQYSSRSLMKCYDEASAAFGWSRRNPQPGSMQQGEWLVGCGCATAFYPTHLGPSTARVRLLANGEVKVQTAAHDLGTGAYTVIGQAAATQLGVPISSVQVELGDTALPPAIAAGGSSTTASTCSAVYKACSAIRDRLINAVVSAHDGPLSGRMASDITFVNGTLQCRDGIAIALKLAFEELRAAGIEEYAEFIPDELKPEDVKNLYDGRAKLVGGPEGSKLMYAMGAEFVEVRVHSRTKEIRVSRMTGAFAAGHLMNTRTVHSQLMGGMIWGVSSALHEATEIDHKRARYINDNLADYLIPVNADIGDVEVILVPEEDTDVNPVGAKGLGELGNVGTAAAVANAIYHATGKRLRDLPIRLDALLPL